MQEEVRQLVVQKVKFSTFLEFGRPNLVSPKLVYRRQISSRSGPGKIN